MFRKSKSKTLLIGLALIIIFVALIVERRPINNAVSNLKNHNQDASSPILNLGNAHSNNVATEYLVMELPLVTGEVLSITGWRIVGGKLSATIGRASPLPKQNEINTEDVIVITRPAKLIVNSGESPIGVSFRENACTGLLGKLQTFTPALSPECANCNEQTLEGYPEYNLCVEAHQNEPDFFYNSWRIYLGSNKALWRDSLEVIRLYDQVGKLISISSY